MSSRRAKAAIVPAVVASVLVSIRCAQRPATHPSESITISVPYEIETLDPHASGSAGGTAIASNFYEPLVGTDATLRPRPALATAWENPDPLTWTFHLRRDVRFHSGRPFRARDVAYSIARLRAGGKLELAPYAYDIDDIQTPDAFTVRLRTREPVTILLAKLQYVFVVPEGASADDLSRHEDGTGPYRLSEWTRGSGMTMRAFDGYWGRRPDLERVTFRLERSPAQAAGDFVSGASQLAQGDAGSIAAVMPRSRDARVERRSGLYVSYLAFDTASEIARFCSARSNPFRQAAVRRAVDLAVDRRRLGVELPSGPHPATQCVPPSIFGFDPAIAPTPHDLAEARRLLASAGYPGGFRVTLHTRPMFAETGRLIARMLGDVGIDVDVRVLADPDFWALSGATFVLDRFACQTGDASEAFEQVIHTPDRRRHLGESNDVGYSNPALDALIERSAEELDLSRRDSMLREIMRTVAQERPIVPIGIVDDVYAIRDRYRWQPREDGDIRAAEITLAARDGARAASR
jgi:peptide/nickel transport system substrate-binding protein